MSTRRDLISGQVRSSILRWLLVCLLFAAPQQAAFADPPQQALEYQVKAAFLLNFTKFVDWPPVAFEDSRSPIAICLIGNDPFGSVLNKLVEGEVVNGRNVIVQRIRRPPAPKSCQVLFVGASEKEVPRIL